MSQAYQRGSLRRVKRANGNHVWEWRYRQQGVMRQESFKVADFPTQKALWAHLDTRIRLLNAGEAMPKPQAATMGLVIDRYLAEEVPKLAHSTQMTDGSMLRNHFLPRWKDVLVADVHAEDIERWCVGLCGVDGKPMSGAGKSRARRQMKQLIDRAMFWRLVPHGPNPTGLVRIKGATQRQKPITVVTPSDVNGIIERLPKPYSLMVLVGASLGLRVEEIMPLRWGDFDFDRRTLTLARAYTHGRLKDTKTASSAATLPVSETLVDSLTAHRPDGAEPDDYLFPSPRTGGPMSSATALNKVIKPIAERLGIRGFGWHSLRHSYKSWQGSSDAKPAELKDLMRHADISTTMNVYGGTPIETMRPYVDAVGARLKPVA